MIKAAIKELQVIKDALINLKVSQEATVQCQLEVFLNLVTKQIEENNSIHVTTNQPPWIRCNCFSEDRENIPALCPILFKRSNYLYNSTATHFDKGYTRS